MKKLFLYGAALLCIVATVEAQWGTASRYLSLLITATQTVISPVTFTNTVTFSGSTSGIAIDSTNVAADKLSVTDMNQLTTRLGEKLALTAFDDSLFSRKGKEWLVPLPTICDTTASAQDSTTVKPLFNFNGLYGRKELFYVYGNGSAAADSTIWGATFNPQDNNPDSLIVWAYTTDEANTSFSVEIYNSAGTIVYSSGNLTLAAASAWTYKGVAFGTFADLNEHAIVYRVRVINAGDAVQIGQTYFKRN